jgi:hypothetical protein
LELASDILCVSKGHAEFLEEKLGREVNVLLNGCDFSLYENIEPVANNVFTIIYTGNIYRKNNDIELFLKALEILMYSRKKRVEVIFVGTPKSAYLWSNIKKMKLEGHIEFLPKMSHKEVRVLQKSADMLLHFCWNNKLQEGNLTGKIFEYISARVPIISIGEQSELEAILYDTKSGKICNSVETIVGHIESIINNSTKLTQLSNETCIYSKFNQFKILEQRII